MLFNFFNQMNRMDKIIGNLIMLFHLVNPVEISLFAKRVIRFLFLPIEPYYTKA
jgi:hypothetical protein